MRSLALALLVAIFALAAASCGGDDETTPAREWADGFCTAVVEWRDELDRIADEARGTASFSTERIRELSDEADEATTRFVDELRELGAPDTESGDEIEESVEELSDTVETERDRIEDAVADVEGVRDAAQAAATVGASLATMFQALSTMLATVSGSDIDEELETAFEESPACDELSS